MATPHVTGAVALYKSVKPGATAAQVRSAILSSAVATASLNGRTVTGGRLDAFKALSY
jgi:subtilisin family serine protease